MQFYYRKDNGNIWEKRGEPTPRMREHLACVSGLVPWGEIEVLDAEVIAHINQSHCLCLDGAVRILPESDWPENQEGAV